MSRTFSSQFKAGLGVLAAIVVLGWPAAAAAGPRDEVGLQEAVTAAPQAGPSYEVKRGDTLGGIAEKVGLSIDEICRWNEGLDPDRIREGQRLWLGPVGREVDHEIQRGETLSVIARKYEVRVRDILGWNRGLRADRIRAGRRVTVYTQVPLSRSQSVGTPNRGRLLDGTRLPEHPGYIIRTHERAWGTEETVRNITTAFDHLTRHFPKAPKLKVHDLSLPDGGPMWQHRSHQSGRDVDLAYFHEDCTSGVCGFRPVGPGTIDSRRSWALLRAWLERDALEAVFIDYKLQRSLYREARRQGATKDELSRWFQYPRGRTHPSGVIRHFPKHHDHMHVRFACHESDPNCKTLRPLITDTQHASKH